MENETVLARLNAVLEFTDQGKEWLSAHPDLWFAREGGNLFWGEFRGRWNTIFVEALEPAFKDYFWEIGVPEEQVPEVRVVETYPGSWVIDAVLLMGGSIGTVYAVLKGVSELPKIAEGIEQVREWARRDLEKTFESSVRSQVQQSSNQQLALPPKLVNTTFTIDARPVQALQPDKALDHQIHLSVGMSRSGFTLENLGDEPMRDVRIGIFRSLGQRSQWSFADAYSAGISLLSGKQTISKPINGFCHHGGNTLDLSDPNPLYVDCWIQDQTGIYLFNFYLE